MKLKRWLAPFVCVMAAAGIPWRTGASIVILNPQVVTGTMSLTDGTGAPIPMIKYEVQAVPHAVGWGWGAESYALHYPHQATWTMMLDGGDSSSSPNNYGTEYDFGVKAFLRDAGGANHIALHTSSPVLVGTLNGEPTPPGPLPISFSSLRRVPVRLEVENGTIKIFNVWIYSALNGVQAESVQTTNSPGAVDLSDVMFTLPVSNAWIYGTALVQMGDGTEYYATLAGVARDLTAADAAEVVWHVDIEPPQSISGTVSYGSSSVPGTLSSTRVFVYANGINAAVLANAAGDYSVRVNPGSYDVRVITKFTGPASELFSGATPVAVEPFQDVDLDIAHPDIFIASMPMRVTGMISPADPISANVRLDRLRADGSFDWNAEAVMDDDYVNIPITPITAGAYVPRYYQFTMYKNSPEYVSSNYVNYLQGHPGFPPFTAILNHAMARHDLAVSRATVFLRGLSGEVLMNPTVTARGIETDANMNQVGTRVVIANGLPNQQTSLAKVELLAEPGLYTLTPRAIVNGVTVAFPQSSILFGEPTLMDPDGTVTMAPDDQQGLQVVLDFGAQLPGSSSVVQTTQGPPLPGEGFTTLCTPNQGDSACPQLYYDIDSTVAIPAAGVEVCIRQQYNGITDTNGNGDIGDEVNGVGASLGLFHYKDTPGCDPLADPQDPASCWETLVDPFVGADPLPSGRPSRFNCAQDPNVCGCADAADCGISAEVAVFQLCGVTHSFSPFTVARAPARFAAGGTGATGPVRTFTVPETGRYRLTAIGAMGGAGTSSPQLSGGCGAQVSGEVALTEGDTLQVLVGQAGTSTPYQGGGGGGTFIAKGTMPLLIAGGGGGVRYGSSVNGRNASLTTTGVSGSTSASYTSGFVAGGTLGRGGNRVITYGAGGGGWFTGGVADSTYGEGGAAFLSATPSKGGNGLRCPPYAVGGFGGGGSGNGCYGAGGGGGYSGGGGGRIAGGGGSYNVGTNQQGEIKCLAHKNGFAKIEWVGR